MGGPTTAPATASTASVGRHWSPCKLSTTCRQMVRHTTCAAVRQCLSHPDVLLSRQLKSDHMLRATSAIASGHLSQVAWTKAMRPDPVTKRLLDYLRLPGCMLLTLSISDVS